ncbi:MAG TPA: hypothetical protein VH985_07555 [Candidatus Binatia bacterium]|jgi:hypothetical protein
MDFESTMQRTDIDDGANASYWDTVKHNGHDRPEQDLMLAVLRDALRNYRKQLRRRKKSWTDDREWFFANDRDRLFSFESICTVLGLDAQSIRKHLRAWESEAAAGSAAGSR